VADVPSLEHAATVLEHLYHYCRRQVVGHHNLIFSTYEETGLQNFCIIQKNDPGPGLQEIVFYYLFSLRFRVQGSGLAECTSTGKEA